MKTRFVAMMLGIAFSASGQAGDDRFLVQLPEPMQNHMLSNMRDHLVTLDKLLQLLSDGKHDQASELAEQRLGMTSLTSHGADHMAHFMPEGMRAAGSSMHRAASRFALVAQEGESARSYAALRDVTAACVACHSSYRIR